MSYYGYDFEGVLPLSAMMKAAVKKKDTHTMY